jgi:hypothetical protein
MFNKTHPFQKLHRPKNRRQGKTRQLKTASAIPVTPFCHNAQAHKKHPDKRTRHETSRH